MTVNIRNYQSKDYPALCKLDEGLFPDMGGYVLFRHIEELFSPLFFIAEDNGTIIGYLLGGIHLDNPTIGKIIRIGVDKNRQRQNIGTQLISTLLSRMKEMGVKTAHLTVDELNAPARAFYTKNGFTVVERREVYFYPNKPRLLLQKTIE